MKVVVVSAVDAIDRIETHDVIGAIAIDDKRISLNTVLLLTSCRLPFG